MTQAERRLYLIRSLLNEKTEYQSLNVPRDAGEQRKLQTRALPTSTICGRSVVTFTSGRGTSRASSAGPSSTPRTAV